MDYLINNYAFIVLTSINLFIYTEVTRVDFDSFYTMVRYKLNTIEILEVNRNRVLGTYYVISDKTVIKYSKNVFNGAKLSQ